MFTRFCVAYGFVITLLVGQISGAEAAAPAQGPSANARVVYTAAPALDARLATELEAPNLIDPQDGRRSARHETENLRQRVIFSTGAGERDLRSTNALRGLAADGFVGGHLIIKSRPGGYVGQTGPDTSPWILQLEGRTLPAQSHFAAVPPTGAAIGLASGLDTLNSKILAARVVAVRGRDGDLWAALYLVEQRGFEGAKEFLRVRTHGADGNVTASLDGPAGLNFALVGYYDAARRVAVQRDGGFWGVAEGKLIDRIKGVTNAWYVDSLGAFFTLEVGTARSAWGVTDSISGAIAGGGDDARELVLSRLDLDDQARARKTVFARAVVPVQGPLLEGESERMRVNALRPLTPKWWTDGPNRLPTLVFGGTGTRQELRRMPDNYAATIQRSKEELAAGRPQTDTVTFAQPTAQWSVVPSPIGVTLFVGAVSVPAQKRSLQVALLVGPGPAAQPVGLSYLSQEGGSVAYLPPAGLASFLPGGAGGPIGLRVFGRLPGSGLPPNNPSFVFDTASARISAVLTPPAAAEAPGSAMTGPAAAASDPAAAAREAADVIARHLAAYNAQDIDALMALFADDAKILIFGGRYNRRIRISSDGEMGTTHTTYTKAMLRRAYEEHFARVPASQQRMLGRKMYRNPAGRFEVRERRTTVSDDAPAPDFERGEALYEIENGRIRHASMNSTP